MSYWLNFLLILGVGAALFYYQTKMASEIEQLKEGEPSIISGSPGQQGIAVAIK